MDNADTGERRPSEQEQNPGSLPSLKKDSTEAAPASIPEHD
jgi:hypothetical protein